LNDEDGVRVRELAASASVLYTSALCFAELACVFHRQLREGSLTAKQVSMVRQHFAEDVDNEVWGLIPVTTDLLRRVDRLVHGLPARTLVRAGDAIQVASAIEHHFEEIWTNDRHLLAAAEAAGLSGKSVS
jgi:predicted nucleic acid-binding protein